MTGFDRFAICAAHAALEADFNKGGILWERPSNARRRESTGVQLHRIGYKMSIFGSNTFSGLDEDSKAIYAERVLDWKLPIDDEIDRFIREIFTHEFLVEKRPDLYAQVPTA